MNRNHVPVSVLLYVKPLSHNHAEISSQFGMGPRICQGQLIALMEMSKVIPRLISRFEFELVAEWETFNHWLIGHKNLKAKIRHRVES